MKNLLICSLLVLGCAVFADTWRMEAEDFITEGKWVKGKHSINYSGEYVMVSTAAKSTLSGKYEIPKAGKYTVWVRTMTMGGNWRKGNISVNGKMSGEFGDAPLKDGMKSGDWYWVNLGVFELPAAEVDFKVISTKGYVRVDALVITDDAKYVPPAKVPEINKIKALDIAI